MSRSELAAEVAQLSAGKVTATTQTVADLLASWYRRGAPELSSSVAREYRRLIDKRLLPALGRVRWDGRHRKHSLRFAASLPSRVRRQTGPDDGAELKFSRATT